MHDHFRDEAEEEEFEDVKCEVEARPIVTKFQYLKAIPFELNIAIEIQSLESVNWYFVPSSIPLLV